MLKKLQHCLKKSRNRTVLFNLTAGGSFSIQILGDISISCPLKVVVNRMHGYPSS